jgi:sRNA-binding regulator protein Hfq
MNKTLLEIAHCILSQAEFSNDFRAETINMACYLVNKS